MPYYSVPQEAEELFRRGLVDSSLLSSAPPEIKEAFGHVSFHGSNLPHIPVNWRFAESVSALKAYQGSMLNVLLKRKLGMDYQSIEINTDHAQLFIMSPWVNSVGSHESFVFDKATYEKYFPDYDKHGIATASPLRSACTNIYKTRDNRFVHIHGSLNPEPTQMALGLKLTSDLSTIQEAAKLYQAKVVELDAQAVDSMMNDQYRQACTICWTPQEYASSAHGQANAGVGIYGVHHIPNATQQPVWWTPVDGHDTAQRPLLGLKVLDLTRIIAGPTVTRELAELGASVLRITAPHVPDLSAVHADLNWGKWNASLDLRQEEDRQTLRDLILESDVVVDGYRPGVMEKWGFSKNDILELFAQKERGVIYAHENCYGWNGPWAHRSGWQQISDACCGTSWEFGRAMGLEEPVTPVFPNSDYCTGICGSIGILQALIERADKGGSFVVDIALNYYSQWLVKTCGTYPADVWDALWAANGRAVFRHYDPMQVTLFAYMDMLKRNAHTLFDAAFMENRESKAINLTLRCVKPVLTFPGGKVRLGYNVGTRGNGLDKARWPQDLLTEVIQ